MVLPNFLIIGAAKSGTTALYRYLRQHPDIFMPDRKEPHHFSFNEQTKLTNGPGDYIRSAITDFTQYCSLFDGVRNETAIGEASPTYMYIPGTAERIYSVIPNTKIIAILRHPAERAFSAYLHLVRDGYEDTLNFEEALRKEADRIANNWGPIWHYTKSGYYFEQLERYYRVFENQKISIIIYDDFKENPQGVISTIFRFLEVDDSFRPKINIKPNVSGIPRSKSWQKLLHRFFDKDNLVRRIARKYISHEIRWRFTSVLRNMNLTRPELSVDIKSQLIELYRNDIINLQGLINYDLSSWLNQ